MGQVKIQIEMLALLPNTGEGGFVPAGGGGGGDDAASFCFSQERRTGVTSGATVVDKAPSSPFWGEFRATLEPGESMVCLVFQLFGARKVASLFFYLFVLVSLFLGFWREKLIVVTSSRRHEGRLVWHRFSYNEGGGARKGFVW